MVNEDIKVRNVTEMGEKQLAKHRERLKGQSRLVIEKDGAKGAMTRQGVFPTCRINPS